MKRRLIQFVPAVAAVAVICAGCSARAPTSAVGSSSREGKLLVSVSSGCPRSVLDYEDVVSTVDSPLLVPANPTAAIVCWYSPINVSNPRRLARQVRLDGDAANRLAETIGHISLEAPAGAGACPMDVGLVVILGFSYPSGTDVGLWYAASGCQTLDNGRIRAYELGNPSFYIGFVQAIDSVAAGSSPPQG